MDSHPKLHWLPHVRDQWHQSFDRVLALGLDQILKKVSEFGLDHKIQSLNPQFVFFKMF